MTLLPRTIIPTWLQVIEVLHLLEDHELVGIEAFRKRDDEAAWSWAVSQRPPGVERGPRSGRSPWRHFAEGEKALSVRRLAPLWVASPDLWPISATELAHLALSDPGTRYRYQAADHVAQLLIRRPDAWGWLRSTVRLFDPDPLKKLADDADDLPWDEPLSKKRLTSSAPPVPPPPPRAAAMNGGQRSTSAPPISTRPTLRRRRPPAV
jgi:hypothetical protein